MMILRKTALAKVVRHYVSTVAHAAPEEATERPQRSTKSPGNEEQVLKFHVYHAGTLPKLPPFGMGLEGWLHRNKGKPGGSRLQGVPHLGSVQALPLD